MCGRFSLQFDGTGLLHAYVATSDDRASEWEPIYAMAARSHGCMCGGRDPSASPTYWHSGGLSRAYRLATV